MKFLLTFQMRQDELPDASANDKCFTEMMDFVTELEQLGVLVFDSQVIPNPPPRRFERIGSSPTEYSEFLGGFFIIDVDNTSQATDLATRCPHRQVGAVGLHALNETKENAYQPDT